MANSNSDSENRGQRLPSKGPTPLRVEQHGDTVFYFLRNDQEARLFGALLLRPLEFPTGDVPDTNGSGSPPEPDPTP